jgi:hemerythrin-like domain-containing protein
MASFGRLIPRGMIDGLNVGQRQSGDLLEFLSAQHVTQWSICELLSKLASDPYRAGASQEAAAVLDYLTERLPIHVATEEHHLYALLKRREIPGDDVDAMFELLRAGHHDSRSLAEELVEGLHDIVVARRLRDPSGFTATANAFCYHQRMLVEWEDNVLFPYARQRLHAQDLYNVAGEIGRGRADALGPSWSEHATSMLDRYDDRAIDLDRVRKRQKARARQ